MHIQNRDPSNPSITTIRQHPNNRHVVTRRHTRPQLFLDAFPMYSTSTRQQQITKNYMEEVSKLHLGGSYWKLGGLPQ